MLFEENIDLTLKDNLSFHFGIKIHPAHNPTQLVLAVVYKKGDQVVSIYFRLLKMSVKLEPVKTSQRDA